MALHLPLQALRRPVVLARERFPDQGNGRGRLRADPVQQVRVVGAAVRFSGPQRNIIERDAVFVRAAVDQSAEVPVSQRKGLLEAGRRTVVVQHEGPLGHGRACRQRQQTK